MYNCPPNGGKFKGLAGVAYQAFCVVLSEIKH